MPRCWLPSPSCRPTDSPLRRSLRRLTGEPTAAVLSRTHSRPTPPPQRPLARRLSAGVPWFLAALGLGAAAWVILKPKLPAPVERFGIAIPDSMAIQTDHLNHSLALSPDGRRLRLHRQRTARRAGALPSRDRSAGSPHASGHRRRRGPVLLPRWGLGCVLHSQPSHASRTGWCAPADRGDGPRQPGWDVDGGQPDCLRRHQQRTCERARVRRPCGHITPALDRLQYRQSSPALHASRRQGDPVHGPGFGWDPRRCCGSRFPTNPLARG